MNRPADVSKAKGGKPSQDNQPQAQSTENPETQPETTPTTTTISEVPLGPPSLNWLDEPLDPLDELLLREKNHRLRKRYVWIHPDKRKASLQIHSDHLYHVLMEFFKQEVAKLKNIFQRQPEVSDKSKIQQAISRAIDEYDWTPWREELRPKMGHLIEEAVTSGARDMGEALREADFDLSWPEVADYAREFGMKRAAELVGMRVTPDGQVVPAKNPKMRIDEGTRKALKRWLQEEFKAGKNWTDIAEKLYNQSEQIGFPYMSDWRARRIARTEIALAYNRGQIKALHLAGITKVEVIDGTQDEICRAVNHKIWTLEEAAANPLGHPNCSRHFLGVIE